MAGVRFRDDSIAYASNWRTVVGVDLAMGLAVLAGGVVAVVLASGWGWLLAGAGLVELFFAGGRAVRWRRLRRRAGL